MNFLDIVNSIISETGTAGGNLSTVVGQTKESGRIVGWARQSWLELQMKRPDWLFLRLPFTFNTVAGQQGYTPAECNAPNFASWRNNSFRDYLTSAGVGSELLLDHVTSYEDFRDYYLLSTRRLVQSRPLHVAIAPDKSLLLGFIPNDDYTVSGEYFRTPQVLIADADIPLMPDRFHYLIVYLAMQKYGKFYAAQEQLTAGAEGAAPLYAELILDQTPAISYGASLI